MQSFGSLMAEADHRPGLQNLAALATTGLVGVQYCCFAFLNLGRAAMAKKRHKGSKFDENFVGIVYSVFECPAFYALSSFACKLLFDLIGQYRGDNNGDLTVAWSQVSERGWRSRTTLYRAKKELIDAGFIHVTRKGRMPWASPSLILIARVALRYIQRSSLDDSGSRQFNAMEDC
ncbi:hypothetical protein [Hydrogenophaga palleronii]|uniref:hypothetical protein n=1 Tax=Hydrogenophaga palleronii TaxID=65655 RepID=UPI0008262CD0|nr:hypothetical protein [Hydrogenophaga palleronii]